MKVQLIDVQTPRTDKRKGPPTGVTVGTIYEVAEVLPETGQYSIINDDFKIARYSQSRFVVADDTPVKPLREAFNSLTFPMRKRIRELESKLTE